MPVSSQTSEVSYSGNASTVTPYAVTFRFDENSWLKVEVTPEDGPPALLAQGVDYTISGSGTAVTASITTDAAIPATSTVRIYRDTPDTQLQDYVYNSKFSSANVESALDKLTMGQQDQDRERGRLENRALRLPNGETVEELSKSLRSGRYIGFDSDGELSMVTAAQILDASGGAPDGVGLPDGGSAGHYLAKESAADADATWREPLFLDVRDFGAVGDGVTDDTDAIQDAIDSAAASTATRDVVLPPGTYKANVLLPRNVNLIGAGTIIAGDPPVESYFATKLVPADDSLAVIRVKEVSSQVIRGFQIVGNGDGVSAYGIRFENDAGNYCGMCARVEEVAIWRFTEGIRTHSVNMMLFSRVSANFCSYGYRGLGQTDTTIYDTCSASRCSVAGLHLLEARGTVILGGDWGFYNDTGFEGIGDADTRVLYMNGGTITWIGGNIESTGSDAVIEIDQAGFSIQGVRWGNTTADNDRAFIRQGRYGVNRPVTIRNCNFAGGTYAETGKMLLWETNSIDQVPPIIEGVEGALRWSSDLDYSTTQRVDVTPTPYPSRRYEIFDEFLGGGLTSGTVGDIGWSWYNWVGTSTLANGGGINDGHPGFVTFATGANSGDTGQINPKAGSNNFFQTPFSGIFGINEHLIVFRLNAITSEIVHVGILGGSVSSGVPSDFLGIKFNPAESANFVAYGRHVSVSTAETSTGVAADTNWHTLRIRNLGANAVRVSVDDGPDVLISSGLPSAAQMSPGALIRTSAAAARSIDLDMYRWRYESSR